MNVHTELYHLADQFDQIDAHTPSDDLVAPTLRDAANEIDRAFSRGTRALEAAYERGRRVLEQWS